MTDTPIICLMPYASTFSRVVQPREQGHLNDGTSVKLADSDGYLECTFTGPGTIEIIWQVTPTENVVCTGTWTKQ